MSNHMTKYLEDMAMEGFSQLESFQIADAAYGIKLVCEIRRDLGSVTTEHERAVKEAANMIERICESHNAACDCDSETGVVTIWFRSGRGDPDGYPVPTV